MEPSAGKADRGTAEDVQTTFRLAVGAVNAGDHQRARALFARVTEARPEIATAWLWRAHLERGVQAKIDFLRRAHQLAPDDARTTRALHRTLLQAGIDRAKAGDKEAARRLLREVTELEPANEIAWLWRVSVAESREDKLRMVDRVLTLNPQNGHALAWRGQLVQDLHRPGAGETAAAGEVNVLVVDDSITVRVLVRRSLEPHGYRVRMAASAAEALEEVERQVPGLIFLDVELPDMSGYALCKRLHGRPRTRGVPVILLASKDGVVDRFRGRMAGALGAVTKPFESEDLLSAAARYLPPRGA
ncbi:MAG: response regulator [Acidobacteria bacterium]|nr:MAG: response regulator [Acidobacteriota bacterium]